MSITKTRAKLVEVARELFAHKGIEATTMNDIALASGKGRRTLYTYFRSKEDVYYAVIECELERLSEKMDSVAAMQADPTEKLFRLVYTHLRVIRETVARNGSLRAEFFRNIWKVHKVRRAFDEEERNILLRVLTEGVEQVINREKVDQVVTIGPAVMMKFVALLTKKYDIPTVCSLNTIMVDGTGMCGACRVTVGGRTRFVCIDGPEFDAHQVDFDQMMMRLHAYDNENKN